jgi:hypothetical protein
MVKNEISTESDTEALIKSNKKDKSVSGANLSPEDAAYFETLKKDPNIPDFKVDELDKLVDYLLNW